MLSERKKISRNLKKYIELSTLGCRMSYVPRLVKAVNFIAIRLVKQGTETARFRIGSIPLFYTRVNILVLD